MDDSRILALNSVSAAEATDLNQVRAMFRETRQYIARLSIALERAEKYWCTGELPPHMCNFRSATEAAGSST